MDLNQIKDWLIPVSSFVGILTVSTGVWVSLREYRLKVKTEARLHESAQAEMDIRLLSLFTEIMDMAHARKTTIISEKVIENLFAKDVLKQEDYDNILQLNQKISNASSLILPVGLGAQIAAIAAIATLAKRHEVLREPALEGIRSLNKQIMHPQISEITQKYLKEFEELHY